MQNKPTTRRLTTKRSKPNISRRSALLAGLGGAVALAAPLGPTGNFANAVSTTSPPEKEALLRAIATGGDIESALAALIRVDPSSGEAARSPALGGEWRLLWSQNAENFSPLLNSPLQPTSLQLLGDAATAEVGPGRVAQVLDFKRFFRLELSSAVSPADDDPKVLVIAPPFRLEAVIGGTHLTLVNSGTDAEFRAINSRTKEAQAAGRNRYEQSYLDLQGVPGDIRISRVTAGDPVIVGSVFVHERL